MENVMSPILILFSILSYTSLCADSAKETLTVRFPGEIGDGRHTYHTKERNGQWQGCTVHSVDMLNAAAPLPPVSGLHLDITTHTCDNEAFTSHHIAPPDFCQFFR